MSGEAPVDNTPAAEPEAQDNAAAAPQESTAEAIGEVSEMPQTLHLAASQNKLEAVEMLLRNKADPNEKDKDGKTAYDVAEAQWKMDKCDTKIVQMLEKAMADAKEAPKEDAYGDKFEDDFEEASPPTSPVAAPAAADPAPAADSEPTPSPSSPSKPSVQINDAPQKDSLDDIIQERAALDGTWIFVDGDGGHGEGAADNWYGKIEFEGNRGTGDKFDGVWTISRRSDRGFEGTYEEWGVPGAFKATFEHGGQRIRIVCTEGNSVGQSATFEKAKPNNKNQMSPGGGSVSGGNSKKIGDHQDLKARTMFSNSTTDGVLKRTTFIHKLSNYPSAPEVSIGSRGENMFMRSAAGPAPGSYNLPHDEKSKFKTSCKFSFGGGSRFGLGQSPTKLQPGPGAYNPKDPSLDADTKVGFGTSVRNKGTPASQANPGPGAYESRATVGGGLMFTARGRHPTSYMRSRSLPGPGAYSPTLAGAYQTSPKCGFGTSVRGEVAGAAGRGQPGPGTYEMQNFKCLGKDSAKYSATSRRRMHDLNSYVTPGPGTYNAHATSFGSPGAYSCSHVDNQYNERDKQRQSQMQSMSQTG